MRSRFVLLLTTLILLLSVASPVAGASSWLQDKTQTDSDFDYSAVDAFITDQMQRVRVPGLALAVVRGTDVVYAQAYGRDGDGQALTTTTPMYIGSTSKPFTALAIMQLVEAGQVALDAPVQEYLPWFQVADPQASRTITIRHLLNHASGLSEFDYLERLPDDTSIEGGVRDLANAGQTYPVGSQSQYFNPNFHVLGAVIEAVSGQSYGDYLQAHILDPLDMQQTYTSLEAARQNGLAEGHTFFFGFAPPLEQPFRQYGLPAGYIISTVEDMAHFAIAMNNAGRYQDQQVLSPENVRLMQTPVGQTGGWYGLGWFVGEHRGMRMIFHGGANEYFKSEVMLFPNQDLAVVLLINQMSLIQAFWGYPQIQYGLVDVLTGHTPEPGLNTGLLGLGLLVAFLVTSFFAVRGVFRLRGWPERMANKTPVQRWRDVLGHLIFPLIFIFLMPVGVQAWMQRGFTWQYAFTLVPDMMVWMTIGVGADLVQFVYKGVYLLRWGRAGQATEAGKPGVTAV
jgi:CubicO group peptidase (beta-lactamase class C family)